MTDNLREHLLEITLLLSKFEQDFNKINEVKNITISQKCPLDDRTLHFINKMQRQLNELRKMQKNCQNELKELNYKIYYKNIYSAMISGYINGLCISNDIK